LSGRDNPFVHQVGIFDFLHHLGIELEVLSVGLLISRNVLDQESIRVEPWKENFSDNSFDSKFGELKGFSSHDWGVAKVKTASISTVILGNVKWIWVVFLTLGHLGSIFSKDDTIHNQIFERSLTLDNSGDNHKGIKPSSGLIETFSDEVSWEDLLELFLFNREWIVTLREWH